MEHRQRITAPVSASHLTRPVGEGLSGNGSHRIMQSRGSTLERPSARSMATNQPPSLSNSMQQQHPSPHLITTTVEIEHPRSSMMQNKGQATSGATQTEYQPNLQNQVTDINLIRKLRLKIDSKWSIVSWELRVNQRPLNIVFMDLQSIKKYSLIRKNEWLGLPN